MATICYRSYSDFSNTGIVLIGEKAKIESIFNFCAAHGFGDFAQKFYKSTIKTEMASISDYEQHYDPAPHLVDLRKTNFNIFECENKSNPGNKEVWIQFGHQTVRLCPAAA